jgi:hypothetical protein
MNVYLDLGDPGGRDFGMRGIWVRGGKWEDQFTSNLGTRWTGSYHSKEGSKEVKGDKGEQKGMRKGKAESKGIALQCTVIYVYVMNVCNA